MTSAPSSRTLSDSGSRLIDPITASPSSTTIVLACIIDGRYSQTRTPLFTRSPYSACCERKAGLESLFLPGERMRTSTPALAFSPSSSRMALDGTKYALLIQSRFFAVATASWVRRSARVTTGAPVLATNAARTPPLLAPGLAASVTPAAAPGARSKGNASAPRSGPPASCQFSAKACCMSLTAGPFTRAFVSRQCASLSPSPSQSSRTPKPPVKPTAPSITTILRWLRASSATPGMGRKTRASQPASVSAAFTSFTKSELPNASTRMRHAIPARARGTMAATMRSEAAPFSQM